SFMPVKIYLSKKDTKETQIVKADEKLEDDIVIETIPAKENEDKTQTEEKYKIKKRPELISDTHPLWTKHPNDCTEEEYKDFYRKVFKDYKEPLFWIHLNMDYPFNLKGILYFPKINLEYESIEGVIKLYSNQVFIADNIKEVIPEFLMLLKGVIDCPDLPLNVSRSALQNDGFVKKIAEYITKKVADKLAGMCKTDKENYDKYWDDISPFVKYGCLKDDKFCEKMNDYILFKNLEGKYLTLPECLEIKPVEEDDDAKSEETSQNSSSDSKTDETKEKGLDKAKTETSSETESDAAKSDSEESGTGEVADKANEKSSDAGSEKTDNNASEASADEKDEEPKEKLIYYVSDELQQSQYINMFKKAKMDAVILDKSIDQPFVSQLEAKNEGVRFLRIDSDMSEALKAKTGKKAQEELKAKETELGEAFKKVLKNDKLTLKLEKLKDKKISSMLTLSEEVRRMRDMMKMYSMPGMNLGDMGGEGETLVLNANNDLVKYVMENPSEEKTKIIMKELYDMARIQQAPLDSASMTDFISRTNEILMKLV
ncbi:MAG: molecular chaperone HtpG, partial [Lachnospiraceae bacterium]|nr:molecular chaperone HtpG [Lachnospiraceae bacterium]